MRRKVSDCREAVADLVVTMTAEERLIHHVASLFHIGKAINSEIAFQQDIEGHVSGQPSKVVVDVCTGDSGVVVCGPFCSAC